MVLPQSLKRSEGSSAQPKAPHIRQYSFFLKRYIKCSEQGKLRNLDNHSQSAIDKLT